MLGAGRMARRTRVLRRSSRLNAGDLVAVLAPGEAAFGITNAIRLLKPTIAQQKV